MKSLPVVAFDAVQREVQAAYDYFEARVAGAGDKFLERYFATVDRLALNPETFVVTFEDYRRALAPRSNIAAYSFIERERAVIVAAIDAQRSPRLIYSLVRGRRRAG